MGLYKDTLLEDESEGTKAQNLTGFKPMTFRLGGVYFTFALLPLPSTRPSFFVRIGTSLSNVAAEIFAEVLLFCVFLKVESCQKKWKQRNPITKKCCKSWKNWNNFLLPWLMLSEEIFLMSFFIRVKALVAASGAKLPLGRKKFDYPTLWWNFFRNTLKWVCCSSPFGLKYSSINLVYFFAITLRDLRLRCVLL